MEGFRPPQIHDEEWPDAGGGDSGPERDSADEEEASGADVGLRQESLARAALASQQVAAAEALVQAAMGAISNAEHVVAVAQRSCDKAESLAALAMRRTKRPRLQLPSTTNFKRVRQFHSAFGVTTAAAPSLASLEDEKLVKLRLDLIKEEVQELSDALQKKDLEATTDALADILYVTYGAGLAFGVDLDAAFTAVHRSNMSKLCDTEELAKETVQHYKEQFEKGLSRYDSPAYRRSGDGRQWVVYNESSGKVLKSIRWSPPDFSALGIVPSTASSSGLRGEAAAEPAAQQGQPDGGTEAAMAVHSRSAELPPESGV